MTASLYLWNSSMIKMANKFYAFQLNKIKAHCVSLKVVKSSPSDAVGPPIYLSWIFQYSSLKYRVWRIWFFPSFNPTGYFFSSNWFFFSSFMARVEYFDGPCLTIYSLQTWILLARNPVQTWKKNPAGYFKLENWKNQVQIEGLDWSNY